MDKAKLQGDIACYLLQNRRMLKSPMSRHALHALRSLKATAVFFTLAAGGYTYYAQAGFGQVGLAGRLARSYSTRAGARTGLCLPRGYLSQAPKTRAPRQDNISLTGGEGGNYML